MIPIRSETVCGVLNLLIFKRDVYCVMISAQGNAVEHFLKPIEFKIFSS